MCIRDSYREAAKEAEEIFDRWADEIDDLDEDYEPDEFFSGITTQTVGPRYLMIIFIRIIS